MLGFAGAFRRGELAALVQVDAHELVVARDLQLPERFSGRAPRDFLPARSLS